MNNKTECIRAVTKDGTAIYRYLEYTNDIQVMTKVIKNNPELYSIISPELKDNINLALLALKQKSNYNHFTQELKDNKKVLNTLFKSCSSYKEILEAFEMINNKKNIYVLNALSKNCSYENIKNLLKVHNIKIEEYFDINKNHENYEQIIEEIINHCPSLIPLASNYISSSTILLTVAKHEEILDEIIRDKKIFNIITTMEAISYFHDSNNNLCLEIIKMIEEKQDIITDVIVKHPELYKECINKNIRVPDLSILNDKYYQEIETR